MSKKNLKKQVFNLKKLFILTLFLMICSSLFAQNNSLGQANADNTKVYQIGDRGPASGIIFFDKGFYSNGWRYLEAAPVETEFTKTEWGSHKKHIAGTDTALGSGRQNTQLIVEYLKNDPSGERNRAAQVCSNLIFGGVEDWYLPSKDELDLMFRNLKRQGWGNFSNALYWSSSQNQKNNAFVLNFKNGNNMHREKYDSLRVRAIRAF